MIRAAHRDRFAVRMPAIGGHRNSPRATNVKPSNRFRIARYRLRRTKRYERSAMRAGPWSKVDYEIRAANRFFVVLDDEHSVTQIAQRGQSIQQALVVTWMQSDRRFIENIEHAAKL